MSNWSQVAGKNAGQVFRPTPQPSARGKGGVRVAPSSTEPNVFDLYNENGQNSLILMLFVPLYYLQLLKLFDFSIFRYNDETKAIPWLDGGMVDRILVKELCRILCTH